MIHNPYKYKIRDKNFKQLSKVPSQIQKLVTYTKFQQKKATNLLSYAASRNLGNVSSAYQDSNLIARGRSLGLKRQRKLLNLGSSSIRWKLRMLPTRTSIKSFSLSPLALAPQLDHWTPTPSVPQISDSQLKDIVKSQQGVKKLLFHHISPSPQFQFVNYVIFYKKWSSVWPIYRKLLLSNQLVRRQIRQLQFRQAAEWFPKVWSPRFFGRRTNIFASSQRPVRVLRSGKWLPQKKVMRYITVLWRVALRVKLEQFFFKQIKQRTYVWLHNIWQLLIKKLSNWKKFETVCIWKVTNKRFRLALKLNVARAFLRTLGLLFVVSGSTHCFAHVFAHLVRKFRRHWQLFRFVRSYMQLGQRCFSSSSVGGFRVIIVGKLGGKMRARKFTFGYGTLKFFMLSWKIDYVRVDSFTRFGIFGIQIWTQLKMIRSAPDELTVIQREAAAAKTRAQREYFKNIQETRRLKMYKNKKKRTFQKLHPATTSNLH